MHFSVENAIKTISEKRGGGLARELMNIDEHVINKEDFPIISSGYGKYKKQKISEAPHIHQKKPNLNKQKELVPPKLFIQCKYK